MTQNNPEMALPTAEWNFSENDFQLSISHFAPTLKQIQLPIPEIRLNNPIWGSRMVYFTLKWTYHKKIFQQCLSTLKV